MISPHLSRRDSSHLLKNFSEHWYEAFCNTSINRVIYIIHQNMVFFNSNVFSPSLSHSEKGPNLSRLPNPLLPKILQKERKKQQKKMGIVPFFFSPFLILSLLIPFFGKWSRANDGINWKLVKFLGQIKKLIFENIHSE